MDRAVDEWSATSIARTAMRAMRWQTSVLQAPMWNWSNSAPEVSGGESSRCSDGDVRTIAHGTVVPWGSGSPTAALLARRTTLHGRERSVRALSTRVVHRPQAVAFHCTTVAQLTACSP